LASHWIALSVFVILALAFDLRSGQRAAPSLKSATIWSIVWTALGVLFGAVLLVWDGSQAASSFLTGFLIEKSLSLDNLFVFAVLFTFFQVPDEQRQRILVLGIAGAIVLRTIFILLGSAALDNISWFTYVLGALLLYTAYNVYKHGNEEIDPDDTRAMKVLRKVLPLSEDYDGAALTTKKDGKRFATPLLAALAMVAVFDVMFAIDSIPAIFAITRETFIVFAANAFSLLGLVSLFFLLDNLLQRFRYLNQGLAFILAYVGVKIILEDVVHVPEWANLVVVVSALGIAAWFSRRAEKREAATPPEGDAEESPSEARAQRTE
jgi:tellurite resistance protein TerC